MSIKKIQIPAFPKAQRLLQQFYLAASTAPERERIVFAESLCVQWKEARIPLPIPAGPDQKDYWYLIQLYALGRHVHKDRSIYTFDVGKEETIYLYRDDSISIYAISSRDFCDTYIEKNNERVVTSMSLTTREWKLSYVPYDILLRLSTILTLQLTNALYFDGYRMHPGLQTRMSLFGTVDSIDAIFTNQRMIIEPLFCIIRPDYGHL